MDGLVLAHAAIVVGINAPREEVGPGLRAEVEWKTNEAERVFTDLREAVRRSPTFRTLSVGEQLAIERVLFTVSPQLGS